MKKLALVTLLAVAASWLLSGPQPNRGPFPAHHRAQPVLTERVEFVEQPLFHALPTPPRAPGPPSPPEAIRTVPWRGAEAKARGGVDRARRAVLAKLSNAVPAWFPKSEVDEEALARPDAFGTRVLLGRLSASEDRAREDLRKTLEREVSDWLAADVPPTWKAPESALNAMKQDAHVQKVTRDLKPSIGGPAPGAKPSADEVSGLDELYTLYRAGQKLDFSPSRRAWIVEMYRHDLARERMQRLGGGLALALGLLAVMAGYIRADEATRGYYTNRLRLVAAAGLGAWVYAAYRFLA